MHSIVRGIFLNICEVCGKSGERHHIVYKSQGGFDFPLNFKYLCDEHHRGKNGPHKDREIDLQYKLELQKGLEYTLLKEYYFMDDLIVLLGLNKSQAKKLIKELRLYKEGYRKKDIIKKLMGGRLYEEYVIEELCSSL